MKCFTLPIAFEAISKDLENLTALSLWLALQKLLTLRFGFFSLSLLNVLGNRMAMIHYRALDGIQLVQINVVLRISATRLSRYFFSFLLVSFCAYEGPCVSICGTFFILIIFNEEHENKRREEILTSLGCF